MSLGRDNPIVESLDRTGMPPWDNGKEPICPVCGESCESIYFDFYGSIVGCENCLEARDSWEWMWDNE